MDLERVEVLKGPQGTLFGQNATGGAINYIAAKPTDEFEAGASLEVNNFGRISGDGYISGPIAETLNGRLAVKAAQGGAWQESVSRNDELGDDDVFAARLLLDWRPTDRLKFGLNLNTWTDKSDVPAGQFLAYAANIPGIPPIDAAYSVLTPITGDNRAADWTDGRDLSRDATQFQAALRIDYDLTDHLVLTSISNYIDLSDDRLVDTDGTALDNTLFVQSGTAESISQELRLTADYDGIDYILGVNFDRSETTEDNAYEFNNSSVMFLPTFFGGANFYNYGPYFSDQKYENKAIFGNVDFELSDRLTGHLGARYTESEAWANSCAKDPGDGSLAIVLANFFNPTRAAAGFGPTVFADGACVTSDDSDPTNAATYYVPGEQAFTLKEDNVSWRAGLDYEVGDNALVYFNVSKGYKAGQMPNVSGNVRSAYAPAKQESVLAYEAGAKVGLLNNTMQLNGALFYYDYEDKQFRARILDPIFGPIETMVNIPAANVSGIEGQVSWTPLDGRLLSAGGTYIQTEVDKTTNFPLYDSFGTVIDIVGSTFPYAPEYQFNADAEYRWNLTPSLEAFTGGSVYYQSDSQAGFSDRINGIGSVFEIRGYTTLDLRAGIDAPDQSWSAYLFGRNVTDEDYIINSTRVLDTVASFAGRPATWGAGVTLKF